MTVVVPHDPSDHWNAVYKTGAPDALVPHPELEAALEYFGPVSSAHLLDLGCGTGSASVFFATQGANVTAIDTSVIGISKLTEYCSVNELSSIVALPMSAFDIDQLGKFDYVFGSMILHHLEPFDAFVPKLRDCMKPGGRAFFYENNAASSLLIWAREHLAGRFGIPKYGDAAESPLTSSEIDMLRSYFVVTTSYPRFLFFGLAASYLTRNHFARVCSGLDAFLYRFPCFRRYSYRQYIYLQAR